MHVERHTARAALLAFAATALGWLTFAGAFVVTLLIAIREAVHGGGSLGEVLMTVTLAQQVGTQMTEGANLFAGFLAAFRAVRRYVWLETYAREQQTPTAVMAPPDRLRSGITLENLSFTYPGTDLEALHDVDVHLPAGSIVALVGENGAGKTSLVKLLSAMYRPTQGRILVDGADLATINVDQWRTHTSAAFQDFVRYELRAGEAVGVGDLPYINDEEVVLAALEGRMDTTS